MTRVPCRTKLRRQRHRRIGHHSFSRTRSRHHALAELPAGERWRIAPVPPSFDRGNEDRHQQPTFRPPFDCCDVALALLLCVRGIRQNVSTLRHRTNLRGGLRSWLVWTSLFLSSCCRPEAAIAARPHPVEWKASATGRCPNRHRLASNRLTRDEAMFLIKRKPCLKS